MKEIVFVSPNGELHILGERSADAVPYYHSFSINGEPIANEIFSNGMTQIAWNLKWLKLIKAEGGVEVYHFEADGFAIDGRTTFFSYADNVTAFGRGVNAILSNEPEASFVGFEDKSALEKVISLLNHSYSGNLVATNTTIQRKDGAGSGNTFTW